MGLVISRSLGKLLGVSTPTCEVSVKMGGGLRTEDYFAKGLRTVAALGLDGLKPKRLMDYLETGELSMTHQGSFKLGELPQASGIQARGASSQREST